MQFVFDELEAKFPNKAINTVVRNQCGDSKLLHRLMQTYNVITFTDGEGDLRKDDISSFVTTAGEFYG